ncbi:MAG TPA: SDR family oxidoreductase [Terriglobia bacterium]|nr:SDR family oxidoreductase [Terriglobia bacterium]
MTYSEDCLQGKVILITGGMGAIGRVVVSQLLKHSAQVAVNDVVPALEAGKLAEELKWPDGRFHYFPADVTQQPECQMLVEKAVEKFGRLDIALCHAGLAQSCPILDYTEADWDKILSLNLKGAFLVAQASAKAMVKNGVKGKIVFTSSWVQEVPWPGITPYNVSKSGMKMLMRGMAREIAPLGIRVNSIAPGIVAVGMAKRQWDTEPDYRARAEKAIPLGYMQPPESVADAFLFLCSGASDYITGTTLLVDGGCSLYPMD